MSRSTFVATLLLVAVVGIVMSKNGPVPPARCLPMGACTAPAPLCLDSPTDLFECDEASGAWVSNYTAIPHNMVIGGPVVFKNDLVMLNNANITFNESLSAKLTVNGTADFSAANQTWYLRVSDADIDKWSEVEAKGSTNYNASQRVVLVAVDVILPEGWNLKLHPNPKCHVPHILDKAPHLDETSFQSGNNMIQGKTFYIYFYTKSQCWWWIVLIGTILAYFALLVLVIVAFKTIPALKAWTTLPIFDTHIAATKSRSPHGKHVDNDEYELDNAISSTSHRDQSEESDEADSVALDI